MDREGDLLARARGIMSGIFISLLLWPVLIFIVWWLGAIIAWATEGFR